MFFIIFNLIILYLASFPTMAVHFDSKNEWITKREQAQPVINKIFSEMEKESRWSEQLRFLIRNNTKGNENENFWKFGDIRIRKKIKKKP